MWPSSSRRGNDELVTWGQDVLGAEVGSETRWSGYSKCLRRNCILEADLTEVFTGALQREHDATLSTAESEQTAFEQAIAENGGLELSDDDEPEKDTSKRAVRVEMAE